MALESNTTTTVTRYSLATSLGLLCARIPLGAYFIFASVMKLRMGVDDFVNKVLPTAPTFLPPDAAKIFLTYLPWVELSVGILVILGLLTRVVAGFVVVVLICLSGFPNGAGPNNAIGKAGLHPHIRFLFARPSVQHFRP